MADDKSQKVLSTDKLFSELEVWCNERGLAFVYVGRTDIHSAASVSDPKVDGSAVVFAISGKEIGPEMKRQILDSLKKAAKQTEANPEAKPEILDVLKKSAKEAGPRIALAVAVKEFLEWLFEHHPF